MSYHVWPVTGYGLIYEKNEKVNDIAYWENEEDDDISEYDLIDFGGNVVDEECDGVYSCTCDLKTELDPMVWFSCKKGVTPFKAAYSSWKEMAQEFIDTYSEKLKLQPIENEKWWLLHLGYIEYTQGG